MRDDETGEASWLTEDPIPLEGGDVGEELVVDYRGAPTTGEALRITAGRPGGPQRTIRARAQG